MKEPLRRKRYSIFLSHSSQDAWLAKVIGEKIETTGVTVWLDEMSLTGGEQVGNAIRDGVRGTNETVVLVSNASLQSQWVAAEIGMALALRKRITPLLNNVAPDAMAPLSGIKSYELNHFEKYVAELKIRKKRGIKR
jgi:hypothetical protein